MTFTLQVALALASLQHSLVVGQEGKDALRFLQTSGEFVNSVQTDLVCGPLTATEWVCNSDYDFQSGAVLASFEHVCPAPPPPPPPGPSPPPPPPDPNVRDPACSCQVEEPLVDDFGVERFDCSCEICPPGFGTKEFSVVCTASPWLGDCFAMDCNGECNGPCQESCAIAGPNCELCGPGPPLPGQLVDMAITNEFCELPPPPATNINCDVSFELEGVVTGELALDCPPPPPPIPSPIPIPRHPQCICDLITLTDQAGASRPDCNCATCERFFGNRPFSIQCDPNLSAFVGSCDHVDCNGDCNGPCLGNCDISGPECPLCVSEPPSIAPTTAVPATIAPTDLTASPTVQTNSPTAAPSGITVDPTFASPTTIPTQFPATPLPTAVPPTGPCNQVNACAADAANEFDTTVVLDLGNSFLETNTAARVSQIVNGIPDAYDRAAGIVCDPCSRRVVGVTVDFVADQENYMIVTIRMGQAAGCTNTRVFDRQDVNSVPEDLVNFLAACDQFVAPATGTCCCQCSPTKQGVSRRDFRRYLQDYLGLPVLHIRELRPKDPATCDPTAVSEALGQVDVTLGDLIPVERLDEWVDAFIQTYNLMAVENCYFLQISSFTFEENPSNLVRRRLNSRRGNVGYGCRNVVCATASGGDFFGTRRRLLSSTQGSLEMAFRANTRDAFAHRRGLQTQTVDSPILKQCLCLDDPTSTPSGNPPDVLEFVRRFNEQLVSVAIPPIVGVVPAVPPVCNDVQTCPTDPGKQFDTSLVLNFGNSFLESAGSVLLNLVTVGVINAYDKAAGIVCDPCYRRVLGVTMDFVATEQNYLIVTMRMGQSGNCDLSRAFDPVTRTPSPDDLPDYLVACSQFVSSTNPSACCCSCNPVGSTLSQYLRRDQTAGVSQDDFLAYLNQYLFLPVTTVGELSPQDPATCGPNIVSSASDPLGIDLGDPIPPDRVDEFLDSFLQTYNLMALESCYFVQLFSMDFVENPSVRRRLNSRRANVGYGCRNVVCATATGGSFFGSRRRLSSVPVLMDPFDTEETPNLFGEPDRRLAVDSPILEQCLCLLDPASPPSGDPPDVSQFVERLNERLVAIGIPPINGVLTNLGPPPPPPPPRPQRRPPNYIPPRKGKGKGYFMKPPRYKKKPKRSKPKRMSSKDKMKGKYGMNTFGMMATTMDSRGRYQPMMWNGNGMMTMSPMGMMM